MKKKLLLLLPGLMALSACGGTSVKDAEPEFLEDTQLHEEIFGSLEDPSSPIKSIRNLDPVDTNTPRIGVQYAQNDGKYSVRYVAAFAFPTDKEELGEYTATWTRSAYGVNGAKVALTGSTVNCTKVYPYVADGSSSLAPASFNPGSTYFVVYTLRNIPADQVGGCLLASLTIDDGDPETALVKSNTIVTTFDTAANAVRASLTDDDLGCDGYFLKGSFGRQAADATTKGDPSNLASFTKAIAANETFLVFNNGLAEEESYFSVLDSSCLSTDAGASNFFQDADNKIKANYGHEYTLYLDSTSKLSLRYLNLAVGAFVDEGSLAYAWTWNQDTHSTSGHWMSVDNGMVALKENEDRIKPCETSAVPDSLTVWDSGSHVTDQAATDYIIPSGNASTLTNVVGGLFTWNASSIPTTNGFTFVINDVDLYATTDVGGNQVKAQLDLTAGDKIKILEKNNSGIYYYSKTFQEGVRYFTWSYDNLYAQRTGKYDFYLKNTNVEDKYFWIEPVAYLVLNRSGETTQTRAAINNAGEIKVLGVSLQVGDILYFDMSYSMCKYYDDIKDDCPRKSCFSKNTAEGNKGEMVVGTAGTYNFYVEIAEGVKTIWIDNA